MWRSGDGVLQVPTSCVGIRLSAALKPVFGRGSDSVAPCMLISGLGWNEREVMLTPVASSSYLGLSTGKLFWSTRPGVSPSSLVSLPHSCP